MLIETLPTFELLFGETTATAVAAATAAAAAAAAAAGKGGKGGSGGGSGGGGGIAEDDEGDGYSDDDFEVAPKSVRFGAHVQVQLRLHSNISCRHSVQCSWLETSRTSLLAHSLKQVEFMDPHIYEERKKLFYQSVGARECVSPPPSSLSLCVRARTRSAQIQDPPHRI